MSDHTIYLCSNPSGCLREGSNDVLAALNDEIKERGLEGRVSVLPSGCQDACSSGPSITIEPEGKQYGHIRPQDAERVLDDYIDYENTGA